MTKFTYQATSLRSLVKQMLPSAESKNISESNWSGMTVVLRETKAQDGSMQRQHLLQMQTTQPTFYLGISMPLTTDEVETDNTGVALNTRDLDTALASFGQRMVTVCLRDGGTVELTSVRQEEDAESLPVKSLWVMGESDDEVCVADMFCAGCCTLPDMLQLLDGLRSAVGIASVRGNGLTMQGVRLTFSPEYLRVEGANPSVTARMHYDAPWTKAPEQEQTCVMSTDAARHLIAALSAFGTSAPVYLDVQDDKRLVIATEGICMEAEIA